MAIVALQKCEEYDNRLLKGKIASGISMSGFDLNSLKNKRVCLKPNLLMPFAPDRAVTTNPEFFRAVAEIIRDYTRDIVLIESPNFFQLVPTMKKAGLFDIAKELEIEIADITVAETLHFENAGRFKNIEISKAYFDVDCIINLPKLKTHGFTYFSGAVKNLFGTMPGLRKSKMHMKAPSQTEFSEFLLDLYGALLNGFEKKKKFIHIMDAVIAMEGEGPVPSGTPKKVGAVIIGDDAIAVDYTAVKLVGLDEKKVFTIQNGFKRGYGVRNPGEITLKGEPLDSMVIHDFKPCRSTMYGGIVWPLTSPTVKNLFTEKPVPSAENCTLCLNCKKICPSMAITAVEGEKIPRFDYRKCIRCYCCMETCPESAISLKKGLLQISKK